MIGLVLLAAGASRRMGQVKGLLAYRGTSLLRHAAEVALATGCQPIVVVLGAAADQLRPELDGLAVTIIENADWDLGLGSSIRTGVRLIAADPTVEATVILLADQPRVTSAAIAALIDRHRRDLAPIVASDYGGSVGVPAVFARAMFPSLLGLPDDQGAKAVILASGQTPAIVTLGHDLQDVDTPEDYDRLLTSDGWSESP